MGVGVGSPGGGRGGLGGSGLTVNGVLVLLFGGGAGGSGGNGVVVELSCVDCDLMQLGISSSSS